MTTQVGTAKLPVPQTSDPANPPSDILSLANRLNVTVANHSGWNRYSSLSGWTPGATTQGVFYNNTGRTVYVGVFMGRDGGNITTTDTVLGTLAVGLHPTFPHYFGVWAAGTYTRALIDTDGVLTVFGLTISTGQLLAGTTSFPLTMPA